jgi:signal transduction histidine kinase
MTPTTGRPVTEQDFWARDPKAHRARSGRLRAVQDTGLLDSIPEESFDRLTRLAARLIGVPVTFLSLVDEHRDFYKSCYGIPEPLGSIRQVASPSICEYAVMSSAPLVLNDVAAIPVLRDIPQVTAYGVRAYLGIPLITDTGEVIGSFCAVDTEPRAWTPRDVEVLTELAQSALREIQLRAAADRSGRLAATAQRSVRAREEVLAVVAHDLRTPLGVIANSAHVMAQLGLEDVALEALNSLRAATGQMAGLINDLLDVTRFAAGHLVLHRQPVRAGTLIQDAVAMLAPLAARNGMSLVTSVQDDLPAVDADYERVLRVFSNLVSNALKFSQPPSVVRLSAMADGDAVRFAVVDQGSGMTPEQLHQMFVPFWQTDVAVAKERRGTGLGLPIAREIVEAHGGTLEASSEPGLGSTFRFTLPTA